MTDFQDRARVIMIAMLSAQETFVRNFSRSAPVGIKRVIVQSASGLQMTIIFDDFEEMRGSVQGSAAITGTDSPWISVEIARSGRVMASARLNRQELDLLSYVPGNWERDFGIKPGPNEKALLPPALRDVA